MTKGTIKKTTDKSVKQKGRLLTILTVLIVAVIILAIFSGIYYFIVFNNIGGVTEQYYSTLKKIPVLNLALPEPPDPLNPKYMTAIEIKKKYIEIKKENESLNEQLTEAGQKNDEYKVFKDKNDVLSQEAESRKQDLDSREAAIVQKELKLKDLQEKIDSLIANADIEAFTDYYTTLDPENAQLIYEKIKLQQQVDENVKKFALVYAEMDPAAAAAIFEKLGTSEIEMIANTLKAMNKTNSAEILESMNPDFAAKVTFKLDALYREIDIKNQMKGGE